MNLDRLTDEIARIVGRENVLSSMRDLLVYEYDAANAVVSPDAVVLPATTEQVASILSMASRDGVSVVARGAGTNLSGGTVPLQGGIVIACTRMNRIDVDLENQQAAVGPGAVNLELQNALAPLGHLFAPDPSSQKVSTIGGNVGENAGGPHCLKYGITTDHVLGLEVVMADGQVATVGGRVEDSPGYDLTGLFVGSEGTLGVVTEAILRLIRAPEAIKTMLAIFDTLEDSGSAVSDIIAEGIIPATLEIMDRAIVEAIESSVNRAGYPIDAGGVLLIELDGLKDGQERQADRIVELCRRNRAREVRVAGSEEERNQLWRGRRAAYSAMVRLSAGCTVHDMTVPRTRLAETLRGVWDIAQRYGLRIGGAAHAGDGNLHPLVLYNPRDPEEMERLHRADREIVELCVREGGTITGEHGVGLEKRDYMPLQFGEPELALMRLIKSLFDPAGILNPGKLLPQRA